MSLPSFIDRRTFFQRALELVDQPKFEADLKFAVITGDYSAVKLAIEGEKSALIAERDFRFGQIPVWGNQHSVTRELTPRIALIDSLLSDAEQLERITTSYLKDVGGDAEAKARIELLKADKTGDFRPIFDALEARLEHARSMRMPDAEKPGQTPAQRIISAGKPPSAIARLLDALLHKPKGPEGRE